MAKLFTIGHSNRTWSDFLAIIQFYQITHVVDIRTIPKSRHVPWTNQKHLQTELLKQDLQYIHMPKLGGLRAPKKNSINNAWVNEGFRGFADYMQTKEFFLALKDLNQLVKDKKAKVVIMCAEAVPWKCHRLLVADAEFVRGVKVIHILNQNEQIIHELTDFAVIKNNTRPVKIFYPQK